jgi:hypothetical protein
MHNEDDLRNVYNPGRKTSQGEYAQAKPVKKEEIEGNSPAGMMPSTIGNFDEKKDDKKQSLATINPGAPTGLEPAPKDWQYEQPHQLKKPLIIENKHNEDDFRNVYNPGPKTSQGIYAQGAPKKDEKPEGNSPAGMMPSTIGNYEEKKDDKKALP